jgi:uncharacterized lipoprotein YmbA
MNITPAQILAFLLLAVASGCAKTPPPDIYLLDSAAPSQLPGFEKGIAVGVGPVELAPYLDRGQIISRESATKLKASEGHQWGEPLKAGFTRVLMVNLGLELDSNRIYEFPTRQRRSLDYQVAVDVLRFDGVLDGEVVLAVRWTLLSGDGKRVLLSKVSGIEETVPQPGYESFVGAQSRAVVQLAREIADGVRDQSTKDKQ